MRTQPHDVVDVAELANVLRSLAQDLVDFQHDHRSLVCYVEDLRTAANLIAQHGEARP